MIRESIKNHLVGLNPNFRYRGEEQTRVETFSDAVFALAITMLLISSTPTRDFNTLIGFTFDLIPFAICITLIVLVWYEHFIFFFRYGFRNVRVIVMNTTLLFIVLFYVYPLKFLATMLFNLVIFLFTHSATVAARINSMMDGGNVAVLMIIYGLGVAAIYLMFSLMYRYALQRADELDLNETERFETKVSLRKNFLLGCIPLLSALLALILFNSGAAGFVSGFTYFLFLPVTSLFHRWVWKQRKLLTTAPN